MKDRVIALVNQIVDLVKNFDINKITDLLKDFDINKIIDLVKGLLGSKAEAEAE